MKQIKMLLDIPFGYMIAKNDCENCKLLKICSYEQLAHCFAIKNQKDMVDKEPEEE